jgi:hypothetical protein
MIPWDQDSRENQRAKPSTDHGEASGKAPAEPRPAFELNQRCSVDSPSSTEDDNAA